jgi:Nucleoside-diphosphate-sugar pyrophosphorylase involved in lipopolysaccharide biosynthesis/translation initiation factor 2B, gamma/epsilon subunits (eIF-2Bgamma/eIF-2Bepsilon)
MKVVILAGGAKSTIADEWEGIPKPMVEIGGRPLLWHIMKQYSCLGFQDFIVCGGYKVNTIKNYFKDYYIYQSDITVDLASNRVEIHKRVTEDWRVTVADTGMFSTTGQRVSRIEKYIDEEMFLVTYGDCLSDIDINDLIAFARENDKLVTMVVAHPTGRNEVLLIDESNLLKNSNLEGKPETDAWTNACIYVFKKRVFKYLNGNYELDRQLLPVLSEREEIAIYRHHGFWCPVETKRDKVDLETRWNMGVAPWKIWKE